MKKKQSRKLRKWKKNFLKSAVYGLVIVVCGIVFSLPFWEKNKDKIKVESGDTADAHYEKALEAGDDHEIYEEMKKLSILEQSDPSDQFLKIARVESKKAHYWVANYLVTRNERPLAALLSNQNVSKMNRKGFFDLVGKHLERASEMGYSGSEFSFLSSKVHYVNSNFEKAYQSIDAEIDFREKESADVLLHAARIAAAMSESQDENEEKWLRYETLGRNAESSDDPTNNKIRLAIAALALNKVDHAKAVVSSLISQNAHQEVYKSLNALIPYWMYHKVALQNQRSQQDFEKALGHLSEAMLAMPHSVSIADDFHFFAESVQERKKEIYKKLYANYLNLTNSGKEVELAYYKYLGQARLAEEDFEQAQTFLEKYAEIDATDPELLFARANLAGRSDEKAEIARGIALSREAENLDPRLYTFDRKLERANMYLKMNDWEKAIPLYEQSISSSLNKQEIAGKLVKCYRSLGYLEIALVYQKYYFN